MPKRSRTQKGRVAGTKALPRQEPIMPDGDQTRNRLEANQTEGARETELVQSPEAQTLRVENSRAEENTHRGPEPGPSKREVSEMSPTQEQHSSDATQVSAQESSSLLSSAALIGIGALIEPELLAGMLIGAGIVLASGLVGNLAGRVVSGVLRPVVKPVVKAGYVVAMQVQEAVAEATEQVKDMVAEARAEQAGAT